MSILKNKKICLTMDVGPSPNLAFTKDYQSGALSFEIIIKLFGRSKSTIP